MLVEFPNFRLIAFLCAKRHDLKLCSTQYFRHYGKKFLLFLNCVESLLTKTSQVALKTFNLRNKLCLFIFYLCNV